MSTDPSDDGPPPPSDHRTILGNTGQNVLGLGIGAVATFAAQVVLTRKLGDAGFGVVTLTTQFAFIAAAATRFGMDVANVRIVAILVGTGSAERSRALVRRSVGIAAAVSVTVGSAVVLTAPWLAERFTSGAAADAAGDAFRAAGVTIPLVALAFTWMGATRGLKVMRPTLFAQWMAQPIGWIVLMVVFWSWTAAATAAAGWAFAASWGLALAIAWFGWEARARRLRDGPGPAEGIPQERTRALVRFGAIRAPATLFSQLLFWTDLFVLSTLMRDEPGGAAQVGVYGAVLRAGQSLFLFLTSVSLTFSPFVADLHHRGERDRLDDLYKSVTRWTLTATIPVLLLLGILPGSVLRVFGEAFTEGDDALRILIVGMIVPVVVGTVGFILIMAGRTGWDLAVYVASFAIDVGIAFALARPDVLGIRGAAIAQALTLSFSAVARLLLVRRFLGIWPFDADYARLIVPTALGGAAMAGLSVLVPDARWGVELLVAGGGGALVYTAAALTVGISPGERAALGRLAGRALGRVR